MQLRSRQTNAGGSTGLSHILVCHSHWLSCDAAYVQKVLASMGYQSFLPIGLHARQLRNYTVKVLLTDTLVSGQFYVRPPSQKPVRTPILASAHTLKRLQTLSGDYDLDFFRVDGCFWFSLMNLHRSYARNKTNLKETDLFSIKLLKYDTTWKSLIPKGVSNVAYNSSFKKLSSISPRLWLYF